MRHLLFAGAAALLAAACDTTPYGEQYPPGEPYPPAYPTDAYPPAPYPQPGPPAYPQPGYPPQGPYPPGPQLNCPVSVSREWQAWVNMMPGPATPTLNVAGKVVTPTAGYQVSFDPSLQIRRGYPAKAFATLRIFPPPAGAAQAVVVHEVRGQWPLSQRIDSVEIRCGEETLATITPVESAR